jgi:hypothetical protein
VKGKQPVAAGVSGSDSGKSKGKQKMKEEDVSEVRASSACSFLSPLISF